MAFFGAFLPTTPGEESEPCVAHNGINEKREICFHMNEASAINQLDACITNRVELITFRLID